MDIADDEDDAMTAMIEEVEETTTPKPLPPHTVKVENKVSPREEKKHNLSSSNRGFVQQEATKAKEVEAFQAKKEDIVSVEVDSSSLPTVLDRSGH